MGVINSKNTRLMITLVINQFNIIANFIHALNNGRRIAGARRPLR